MPTGGTVALHSCVAQLPCTLLKTADERVLQKVRCCCAEQILKLLDPEEKDDLSYYSYTTKGVHVHIKNLVGRNCPICMTLATILYTVHYLI